MTEIIASRLHRKAVNTDGLRIFRDYLIGDKILSCTVSRYDRRNDILRNAIVVCEKLLRIFRQAVTSVTERWIIVMVSDTRVKAYTLNYRLRVESSHLCVCIELVEIRHTEGKIGICKKLDRLRLCRIHEADLYVLLDRTFREKVCKGLSNGEKLFVSVGYTDYYAARVEVIVKCTSLAEKFRAEQYFSTGVSYSHPFGKTDGNGGLNYHKSVRVNRYYLLYNALDRACVEMVLRRIVIRRR